MGTCFQHTTSFMEYLILLCDRWLCRCGLRFLTVLGQILPVSLPHLTRYPIDYVIPLPSLHGYETLIRGCVQALFSRSRPRPKPQVSAAFRRGSQKGPHA